METLPIILKKSVVEVTAYEGKAMNPTSLPELSIHFAPPIPLTWSVEPSDGDLPGGFVCSKEGKISGTLAKGSAALSPYELMVVIQGENIEPVFFTLILTVLLPPELADGSEKSIFAEKEMTPEEAKFHEEVGDIIKNEEETEFRFSVEDFANYWTSFSEGEEVPSLEDLLTRGVTEQDIYYMLSRFAMLTVWNADDLRPADQGKAIEIKDISPRYRAFDFGVAIVGIPKELYGTNRTLADAVQTAKALIQEAHARKWNVELTGFDRMVTAAWVEVNQINEKSDQKMLVKNYQPTKIDYNILSEVKKMKQ